MGTHYFAILDLGTPGLILILLIALLLFGGKKLPELSRGIGTSIRELRKGMSESESNEKNQQPHEDKAKRESAS